MREEELHKAFLRIKEEIKDLESQFSTLKEALSIQNNVLIELVRKLTSIEEKNEKFFASKRNKRANQSINHLNTYKNETLNQGENICLEEDLRGSIGNKGVKERLSHVKQGKEQTFEPKKENKERKSVFRLARDTLDKTFNKISKQELKVFLTIYQLEEDHSETSYRGIAEKMDLTEHCIRAHICSLFKKKVPLYKVKLNNRLILLFVDKDFKSLNLKQKLINHYYKTDPYQSTLFELYD